MIEPSIPQTWGALEKCRQKTDEVIQVQMYQIEDLELEIERSGCCRQRGLKKKLRVAKQTLKQLYRDKMATGASMLLLIPPTLIIPESDSFDPYA